MASEHRDRRRSVARYGLIGGGGKGLFIYKYYTLRGNAPRYGGAMLGEGVLLGQGGASLQRKTVPLHVRGGERQL